MFNSARRSLTAWYLLIIMLISIVFSLAFYHLSSRELERAIFRTQFRQLNPGAPLPDRFTISSSPRPQSLEDLERAKSQLISDLILLNIIIFIFAGAAGYFLAGRTLRPIKKMMDDQNTFITHASHELRTPIAVLRAQMEGGLLEKDISDKEARALIKSNLEELDTLQALSDDLLKLTKMQIINSKSEKTQLDIKEILLLSNNKVAPLAAAKKISIKVKPLPGKIIGDKKDLTELFVLLLENAIKYSPENTTIYVHVKKLRGHMEMWVKDQGVGISSHDATHIFDRFYRSEKTRATADGHGLGLSIAKRIVEDHKGSIEYKSSKKSAGSTFIVRLPHSSSTKNS